MFLSVSLSLWFSYWYKINDVIDAADGGFSDADAGLLIPDCARFARHDERLAPRVTANVMAVVIRVGKEELAHGNHLSSTRVVMWVGRHSYEKFLYTGQLSLVPDKPA